MRWRKPPTRMPTMFLESKNSAKSHQPSAPDSSLLTVIRLTFYAFFPTLFLNPHSVLSTASPCPRRLCGEISESLSTPICG